MVTGAASSEAALLLIDAARGRAGAVAPARLSAASAGRRAGRGAGQQDGPGRLQRPTASAQVAEEYRAYLRGPGRRADLLHPDLGARGRQHRRRAASACPGTRARPCSQALDQFELRATRRSTGRCACRSRTSTSSTSAGSSPAGSSRGRLAVGDELRVLAVEQDRQDQVDRGLARARAARARPSAGQSIGITLDEQIFVERGEVDEPPRARRRSRATCSGRACSGSATSRSQPGNRYTLKLGTHRDRRSRSQAIERVIDTGDLSSKAGRPGRAQRRSARSCCAPAACWRSTSTARTRSTGRFVLVEDYLPVGGGIISMEGYPDQRELVTRSRDQHHRGRPRRDARGARRCATATRAACSGSPACRAAGKSTLALALEARAVRQGLPRLRAGRRQHPRRPERQSRLLARGPRREHPPRRRGRGAVRRCRLPRDQLVHLALSRPIASARAGRGAGRVPRDLHPGARSRSARSAIPRASTSARAPARSRSSPASARPTRRPTARSWRSAPTCSRSRTA